MASDGSEEFRLVSPTISNEGKIPRHYTDEGQGAKRNVSPPLEWYNLPEGTKTLALVVDDIDAPDPEGPIVPWVHWVVVNIPPTVKGLPEGFSGKEEEAGGDYAGIKEGNNDWKIPGWRGPRLPNHGHRFEFRLYALDDELHLGNKDFSLEIELSPVTPKLRRFGLMKGLLVISGDEGQGYGGDRRACAWGSDVGG